jgi:hypothetical protein
MLFASFGGDLRLLAAPFQLEGNPETMHHAPD